VLITTTVKWHPTVSVIHTFIIQVNTHHTVQTSSYGILSSWRLDEQFLNICILSIAQLTNLTESLWSTCNKNNASTLKSDIHITEGKFSILFCNSFPRPKPFLYSQVDTKYCSGTPKYKLADNSYQVSEPIIKDNLPCAWITMKQLWQEYICKMNDSCSNCLLWSVKKPKIRQL